MFFNSPARDADRPALAAQAPLERERARLASGRGAVDLMRVGGKWHLAIVRDVAEPREGKATADILGADFGVVNIGATRAIQAPPASVSVRNSPCVTPAW
jgi:hypothetical protein